jgi:elongation factor G
MSGKFTVDRLRNIGIFAHIDAGKTSLTERILFLSGRLRSPGSVDEGTTTTDYLNVERERGITVKAACVRLEWRDCAINLIDTPGHVDFGSEVERSLRVLDGAIVALCGVAGVQSRTEAILRAAARRHLCLLAFVNKMDRRGASFAQAAAELAALEPRAVPVQLPWGEGPEFGGVIDLVGMRLVRFRTASDAGPAQAGPQTEALPPEMAARATSARARIVEALAESDEGMLAAFANGIEPAEEALRASIRAACVAGRFVPVLCGSAFFDDSVACLLDAVRHWLPSPLQADCPEGVDPGTGTVERRECRPDAPLSSFVFKTQADEHHGRLSWLRVWSGRMTPGDRLVEAGTGQTLRVQRIFAIQADALEDLDAAEAGDIVGVGFGASGRQAAQGRQADGAGRSTAGATGSSLCDPSAPILYEPLEFAEPVVSLALEPVARADGESLTRAVALLLEEDPSLQAKEDRDTGRVILSGMGELHLEVAVERLRMEHGVRLRAGSPRVSYREALARSAVGECDFDRDMNGERIRADARVRLAPRPQGSGDSLAAAAGLRVPPAQLEAFRRGVESALSVGPVGGWPVEDVDAELLSLAPPTSRQADLAVEIACSMAARDALTKAGSVVMEPWMRVEITAPEDCLGPSVALVMARGGRVESIEDSGVEKIIQAAAPMRLLFGFATELRSATAGRASHLARFLRFEQKRP